ncbi:MAG: hypothetical protein GX660_03455 [Clostridiaceae bacterium]|nr:hypothetical protein [Clostridiaceae bacterium]
MSNPYDILKMLVHVKKDDFGSEHYYSDRYCYQSVKKHFPDISQEEFKEHVAFLINQRFVEVNAKDNGNGIIDGSIKITKEGLEYYLQNKDIRKIGF